MRAVLFDRDGTIIQDVPYNGDPERVEPVAGAKEFLDTLRGRGVKVAVVTNQSGVARGFISLDQVHAVNARVDDLLGPFAGFFICPHGPDDGCRCRKPMPGLLLDAAGALGVAPCDCLVIGDKDSDIAAATVARMRSIRIDAAHPLRSVRVMP